MRCKQPTEMSDKELKGAINQVHEALEIPSVRQNASIVKVAARQLTECYAEQHRRSAR